MNYYNFRVKSYYLEMISPINARVQRKIRRCPESLLFKVSNTSSGISEKKLENESDCDILQCISWAKNLGNYYFNDVVRRSYISSTISYLK